MRILHLLNHTRRLNGHVHAAVDLACAQKGMGHDVAVASEGGDFSSLLAARGVDILHVPHRRSPGQLLRGISRLGGIVRTWRADLVHAHMMTSALIASPVCAIAGIPLVTTVHNAFEKSAVLMGLGTRIIAVSEAVRRSMERRGLPASRLRTVLNGTIGSVRFEGKDRRPKDLQHPAIVFMGGLHPRKGLPDLLKAFDSLFILRPDARLYVLGGGPHEEEYRTMAGSLTCGPAVTFVGALDEPFPYLAGADIFVLPSLADPAPLVLPEAREAGCAIIATDVDGIPELLGGGEAGILVPPGDPSRLAEELIRLTEGPECLREWRARSQINIDYLRIERVARETLEIYREAFESRIRRRSLSASGNG